MKLRYALKALLAVVCVGVLVYVLFLLIAKPAPEHPWFAPRRIAHTPLVVAHQGGEGLWPSNTMVAFDSSVLLGSDVLDTDVHMTKDGVFVLMHDQTVDRTTDGSGAIRDMTWAEIRELDAGYGFTLDDSVTFPYRGKDIGVPKLEELFRAYPLIRFNIEIKQVPPGASASLCALIRQYGMQDMVLVGSFAHNNLRDFRTACPEVATSATRREAITFFLLNMLRMTRAYTPPYHAMQVPEYQGPLHILTRRFVEAAHARGLSVQPWTIDKPEDMRRIIDLGVEGINTNYPDRLLKMVK
jgi:glycerophosphoryl diester phosphodiesterase